MKLPGLLLGGLLLAFAIWGSLTVFRPATPTSVIAAPAPSSALGPASSPTSSAGSASSALPGQALTVVEAEAARRPSPLGAGRAPQSAAPPVGVSIPRLEIASSLEDLGLTDDGALEAPGDYDRAGWFTGGTLPGQQGPAVIAGHVDSDTGPAVFTRLHELVSGDEVFVDQADGQRLRFVVTRTEQVSKGAFPTDSVYGATTGPELRLVTCGGDFDRAAKHYLDNVVVYAELA